MALALATGTAPGAADQDPEVAAAIAEAQAAASKAADEAVEKVMKSSRIQENRIAFCRSISSSSGDWIASLDRLIGAGLDLGDRLETIKLCGFFLEGQLFQLEQRLKDNSGALHKSLDEIDAL